jgi:hypothetical protein
MASLVQTEVLFQLRSTDLNGTEQQVNGTERHYIGARSMVSSSYLGEQDGGRSAPICLADLAQPPP